MKFVRLLIVVAAVAIVCALLPAPIQAQAPTQALGLVANSFNGYIGNAGATEGSSVYSGDYLNTQNDGSLLVRIGALSLELHPSSAAHIYSTPYGAIVELNHGTVLYTTPGTQRNIVIVASDIRVTPSVSQPDFGRVSIDDPCNITVYSQRGQADVQAGSESHTVEEGKAYRVRAVNQLSYRKYLSPDEDDYHRYHEHTPCAPMLEINGHMPIPGGQSRFMLLAAGVIGGLTFWGVQEAFESPARP
jgi:hypothetical protein